MSMVSRARRRRRSRRSMASFWLEAAPPPPGFDPHSLSIALLINPLYRSLFDLSPQEEYSENLGWVEIWLTARRFIRASTVGWVSDRFKAFICRPATVIKIKLRIYLCS